MGRIMYRSTGGSPERVTFKEALLRGQSPDYGLYMPERLPRVSRSDIEHFGRLDYSDIAYDILIRFLESEVEPCSLRGILDDIYTFPVPLKKADKNIYILWLDRGPTASFKDFAGLFLSRLMSFYAKKDRRRLTVLVATSGDTGGAIAGAFYGMENITVAVLFPEKEITAVQRRQMTTLGKNILPISVEGKFDDCQALVKRAFNDPVLSGYNLTSANSINFGRLLPQIVYYFYAYSRLLTENVLFSVPSGNFGNLMGGVFGREMGMPVEKFIVAVNRNDEFPAFLSTGSYRPVIPSLECSSNAMNVGHPSNLARLVDLYGGRLTDERDESGNVIRKGVMKIVPDIMRLRKDFVSYSISEEQAAEVIKRYYGCHGLIIEPHGAVALAAAEEVETHLPVVALETADPAKFPEKIRELLEIEPPVPDSLQRLDGRTESFIKISSGYEELRETLIGNL